MRTRDEVRALQVVARLADQLDPETVALCASDYRDVLRAAAREAHQASGLVEDWFPDGWQRSPG